MAAKKKAIFVAIYKTVRNIHLKNHGWVKFGRFVKCRPEFAKNMVIRRELVRCSAEKQASAFKKALWIDVIPDPNLQSVQTKI